MMTTTASFPRLISLDVFHGATIAAMIVVNNPGSFESVYPRLRHAAWHRWTLTDWIFPFFLWIAGVAMTMSVKQRKERGESPQTLLSHAVRRSSSNVLFTGGWAALCFASVYWVTEVKSNTRWVTPFVMLGMNAITVYAVSEIGWSFMWTIAWQGANGTTIFLHNFLYNSFFAPLATGRMASFLFALTYTLPMFLLAWVMAKRKFYLKL